MIAAPADGAHHVDALPACTRKGAMRAHDRGCLNDIAGGMGRFRAGFRWITTANAYVLVSCMGETALSRK